MGFGIVAIQPQRLVVLFDCLIYYALLDQGIDLNAGRLAAASLMLVPFALVFAGASLDGESLQVRIRKIVSASPALAAGFVGLEVVDVAHGRVLAGMNSDHFFAPASNTKLLRHRSR